MGHRGDTGPPFRKGANVRHKKNSNDKKGWNTSKEEGQERESAISNTPQTHRPYRKRGANRVANQGNKGPRTDNYPEEQTVRGRGRRREGAKKKKSSKKGGKNRKRGMPNKNHPEH